MCSAIFPKHFTASQFKVMALSCMRIRLCFSWPDTTTTLCSLDSTKTGWFEQMTNDQRLPPLPAAGCFSPTLHCAELALGQVPRLQSGWSHRGSAGGCPQPLGRCHPRDLPSGFLYLLAARIRFAHFCVSSTELLPSQ